MYGYTILLQVPHSIPLKHLWYNELRTEILTNDTNTRNMKTKKAPTHIVQLSSEIEHSIYQHTAHTTPHMYAHTPTINWTNIYTHKYRYIHRVELGYVNTSWFSTKHSPSCKYHPTIGLFNTRHNAPNTSKTRKLTINYKTPTNELPYVIFCNDIPNYTHTE